MWKSNLDELFIMNEEEMLEYNSLTGYKKINITQILKAKRKTKRSINIFK